LPNGAVVVVFAPGRSGRLREAARARRNRRTIFSSFAALAGIGDRADLRAEAFGWTMGGITTRRSGGRRPDKCPASARTRRGFPAGRDSLQISPVGDGCVRMICGSTGKGAAWGPDGWPGRPGADELRRRATGLTGWATRKVRAQHVSGASMPRKARACDRKGCPRTRQRGDPCIAGIAGQVPHCRGYWSYRRRTSRSTPNRHAREVRPGQPRGRNLILRCDGPSRGDYSSRFFV